MIQVPPNANVVVMHEPINFRNGIDGTAAIARTVLEKEPMDGAFFVFRNRRRHMLRVLYYDGSGFWLCTKRLSRAAFAHGPPATGRARAHLCSPASCRC